MSIFDKIKQVQNSYLQDYLPRLIPNGHWEGQRYVAGSIDGGKGHSFSFDLKKGVGTDFAHGDQARDIIDLVAEIKSMTKKEAVKFLEKEWGINDNKPVPVVKETLPKYTPVHPVPEGKNLVIGNWWTTNKGAVQGRWAYYNDKGQLLGYVVRFEDPSAKAIPFQWCGNDGWQSIGFPEPRPLYNLFKIASDPRATILIVEGEKDADAATLLFPSFIVTTWMGGANAVAKSDWPVIQGRDVIVWRDNDMNKKDTKGVLLNPQPGKKAELDICRILSKLNCTLRVFKDNALQGYEDGWGAADLALTGQQANDWLKASLTEYQRGGADVVPSQVSQKSAQRPINTYFKCLGQVGNKYYFYNYSSGQVVNAGHDGMSEMFLMSLSNGQRNYWPSYADKKPDWKAIGGELMSQCHDIGQFDLGQVRGRGTWEDSGQIITNTGNGLIVKNKKLSMNDFDSDFVYLRGKKLDQQITDSTTREELQSLLTITETLRWEDKICGKLLAGWLMAAPICGALPWRSHVYISGPAGSGKSWLYENIISRVLGKVSMRVSSKTTEAGIRHALGPDALPVIFDEAEAESVRDAERMQGIMDLARQASSPDGAPILKGTANQEGAKIFYIRSSFCFLSIMPSIRQYADETRITILTLKNKDSGTLEESKEKFKKLTKDAGELLRGNFADRFTSYADSVAGSMRINFQIFADLGIVAFGNKRFADQLAMLLAGYYAYFSKGIISEGEATKLLEKYNWQSVIPSKESNNQARLISRIAQYQIEVQSRSVNNRFTSQVGELVAFVSGISDFPEQYSKSDAEAALRRKGFIYDHDFKTVVISNQSEFLKTILAGTPWSVNWAQALKAIPGSVAVEKVVSFGGFKSRAMSIPVTTFLDTSEIV